MPKKFTDVMKCRGFVNEIHNKAVYVSNQMNTISKKYFMKHSNKTMMCIKKNQSNICFHLSKNVYDRV